MKHIELGQSAVNRVIENLNASIKARYSNTFSLNSALYVVTNDFVTVANDGSAVEITPSPAYFTLEVAREIAQRPWVSESGKPAKMRRVTADAWHDGYGDSCIDTLTTLYQPSQGRRVSWMPKQCKTLKKRL